MLALSKGLWRASLIVALAAVFACDDTENAPLGPSNPAAPEAPLTPVDIGPAAVTTTTFTGNIQSCAAVPTAQANWVEIKVDPPPSVGSTVVYTGPGGVQISVTRTGDKSFTWSLVNDGNFTQGIDVVVNKAGNGGIIIDYRPSEGTSGTVTYDFAPSHLLFCYDPDPLARILLSADGANEVGDAHTFTATLQVDIDRDGNWNETTPAELAAAVGQTITFALASGSGTFYQTGTTTPATTCTTGAAASCTIDLVSTTAGTSVVNASASFTVAGSLLTPSTANASNVALGGDGPATKIWVDATITITPNGTNAINDPHTFTVTVTKNNPSPTSGLSGLQAAAGETPSVIITSVPAGAVSSATVNGAAINAAGNTLAATDAAGESDAIIVSTVAGVFTANAYVTLTIPVLLPDLSTVNVVINRDTDPATTTGAGPGGSGPAVKTYVAGTLIWEKRAGSAAGALLGGATFSVCRTHDVDGIDITDECQVVADNGALDADADNGQFSLVPAGGLDLGTWVITETIAPAGYDPDPTPQTVILTIANPSNADATLGDVVPIFVNLPEENFEGCTPGSWRNQRLHLWDAASDPLAVTAGFYSGTSFNTFFNLTSAQSGFSDALTMGEAINLGGGGANKLARHAVAALLNVAAGLNYDYPTGVTNVTELYDAIRDAYLDDTYEPLATELDAANNEGCTI